VHGEQVGSRKESLDPVYPWRENSIARSSILEHIWRWKLKNHVVIPEEWTPG
jgi:hypothetical protein